MKGREREAEEKESETETERDRETGTSLQIPCMVNPVKRQVRNSQKPESNESEHLR